MKHLLISIVGMLSIYTSNAQQVIDVHCHNIFPEFTEFLERHGAAMKETFPLPQWDIDTHLEFMENAGIGKAILSMSAPQPYYGNTDECTRIVRFYNEASARLKSDYPGKFLFCASLPLPDVDAAIEEAIYALDKLGADGIKLATNSRGQYVGDAALDTLMQILNERHAIVMLHPHKPSPVNDGIIATTPLAVYEYPAETTRTVVKLIARNIPARYPDLKFVVPHCGLFLPLALPRMKAVYPAMAAKGLMEPIDWDANLKAFYYDLAGGATPEVVKALLTITTPDRLLYGSDYPYQPATVLTGNLKQLRTWITDDAELAPFAEKILHDNALKLFGR